MGNIAESLERKVYRGAIEKIIVNGAEAWYRNTVRINPKFLQIQRIVLKVISKTYNRVSTDPMNILDGILPLDIKLREDMLKFIN